MTDHDAGYVQALKDVRDTVCRMVNDLGATPENKDGMRRVVSYLADLIQSKEGGQGTSDADDAPDPLSGSF